MVSHAFQSSNTFFCNFKAFIFGMQIILTRNGRSKTVQGRAVRSRRLGSTVCQLSEEPGLGQSEGKEHLKNSHSRMQYPIQK